MSMSRFGKNLRVTARASDRARLHALMTEGLGARSASPRPELETYRLDDDFNIGVFYVNDSEALSDADAMRAPWLEIRSTIRRFRAIAW
jgi:hypothetical protein